MTNNNVLSSSPKLLKPDSVANKATDHQQKLHVGDQNNKQPFPRQSGGTFESQNKSTNIKMYKRQNVNRLRPHDKYKQNQLRLEQMLTNINYKRYFKIQANEERNLANINVIKVNKQMTVHLNGKLEKVMK